MAKDERTEKPTAKKIRDARKKGQVARSREIIQVAVLAVSVVVLGRWGGHVLSLLETELAFVLSHTGDAALRTPALGDVGALVIRSGGLLAIAVAPIAAAAALTVVAASLAQTGWLVTTEPLKFNWGRLNPAKGLKRFGSTGGYDWLKMTALVTSLGLIAIWATQDLIHDVPRLARTATASTVLYGWNATDRLLRRFLLVLVVVAAADYVVQRYRMTKSLKMTKQEVKDEARQQEGSPEVKGRIRRIPARDAAPAHAERDQGRDRRRDESDALRGGARVPPRHDGGPARRGEGARAARAAHQGDRPRGRCAARRAGRAGPSAL